MPGRISVRLPQEHEEATAVEKLLRIGPVRVEVSAPAPVQPRGPVKRPPPPLDLDIKDLLIQGEEIRAHIRDAIQDANIELAIDGSSKISMEILDAENQLINSKMFNEAVRATIGGQGYELGQVTKNGSSLGLTFEDERVAILRRYKGVRKAFRDRVTRAQFALSLIREVKEIPIRFYSPDLHVKQPIGRGQAQPNSTVGGTAQDLTGNPPGFRPGARLTVKGETADEQQKRFAATILAVGITLNAPRKALISAMATAIVESTIRMMRGAGSDRISYGVFQDTFGGTGPPGRRSNLKENAKLYYLGEPGNPNAAFHDGAIKLAKRHPNWTIGQISQAVQRSAYPLEYDKRAAEAERWVNAYNGAGAEGISSDVDGGSVTTTVTQRYAYERKKGEDTWTCLGRLAEEVGWRRFFIKDRLYFIAETTLINEPPVARVNEGSPGVDQINFDIAPRKKADKATIECQYDQWFAPPGSVIILEKLGPANGDWIVESCSRSLFSKKGTINLKRPSKPLPEPAPQTTTTTSQLAAGTTGAASGTEGRVTGDIGGLQPDMLKFVKLIAGQVGREVRVTSGLRRGDSGSNHSRGAGADLSVGGMCSGSNSSCRQGDEICAAALIVCGESPDQARRNARSGQNFSNNRNWNGHSVEIGWRTHVSGNHYDHVHVGFDS